MSATVFALMLFTNEGSMPRKTGQHLGSVHKKDFDKMKFGLMILNQLCKKANYPAVVFSSQYCH